MSCSRQGVLEIVRMKGWGMLLLRLDIINNITRVYGNPLGGSTAPMDMPYGVMGGQPYAMSDFNARSCEVEIPGGVRDVQGDEEGLLM
jgi:hypothetical protein